MNNQESTTSEKSPWEKVCERQGKDPVKFLPYPQPKDGHERFMNATAKMTVIVMDKRTKGKKEIVKINWENGNWKYYPWMDMTGSGPSFHDSAYSRTSSHVGSRLCSLSSDDVYEIKDEFPDVLHDMFQEED